ncbi:hypothetical protein Droror1_Dr00012505 [Drosera rotundifolia]
MVRTSGGCCIARNSGSDDLSDNFHQIMLRFRPIAPKPPPMPKNTGVVVDDGGVGNSRSERGKKNNRKRKYSSSSSARVQDMDAVMKPITTTLSLLPEKPDLRDVIETVKPRIDGCDKMMVDRTVMVEQSGHVKRERVYVMVESVVGTWTDAVGTTEDAMLGLERDTCPGFVSNVWGRVTWTNEAFRRMCDVAADVAADVVVVGMIGTEKAVESGEGLTCMVRVKGMASTSSSWLDKVAVPADVWRVEVGDGGGFAWRLDVEAALRLGR